MAEIFQFEGEHPEPGSVEKIRSIVEAGGVIAFPTDTFYGLGADPFNPNAVSRIFEIKQRPADKPLLILIHALDLLDPLTRNVSDNARKLMKRFWPGPLTLVFQAVAGLPEALTAGTGTLGIRQPKHALTRRLLESLNQPLTAPSANASGKPEPTTAQQVDRDLGPQLDAIVDGGPTPGGQPSTVLDTTTDPPTLLREGAVSRAQLETVLPLQIP